MVHMFFFTSINFCPAERKGWRIGASRLTSKTDQLLISWKFPASDSQGRKSTVESATVEESDRRTKNAYGGVAECNRWRKARRRESVLAGKRSPGSSIPRRGGERSANARRRYRQRESARCRVPQSRVRTRKPRWSRSIIDRDRLTVSPFFREAQIGVTRRGALRVEPGCQCVSGGY